MIQTDLVIVAGENTLKEAGLDPAVHSRRKPVGGGSVGTSPVGTLNRMTNEDNHKGLPLHESDRPGLYGTMPHYGT